MPSESKVMKNSKLEKERDVWIHTVCNMCYTSCGIIVHRVDGVVVMIQGDPNCPDSWGKLCAKGNAGLMGLYDPYRVRTPLKRTNPEKGIGVEPKWQEITWEEALEIVSAKLKRIREDDPRKLFIATFDTALTASLQAWSSAFGLQSGSFMPANYYCGAALHLMTYLTNASFHSEIDLEHCNYCILIGNQKGFMVGVCPNINTQKMAEARSRGMKLVVIDPLGSNAAAKADEWIPIRPGTDGALALAMLNVLLNEVRIFDQEFLEKQTNGPYLVGPDGHYMRDQGTAKPLVWDIHEGIAKSYDSKAEKLAIEGIYNVSGVECKPAFQLLKDHVKKYSPEGVSSITTVPSETIRRIAVEFGQAARVGSEIVLDGKVFPYRPAAVNQYRGAYSHKHGTHTALAIQLLNLVIGGIYAPGGYRGFNPVGPSWGIKEGRDGLVVAGQPGVRTWDPYEFYNNKPGIPHSVNLNELFPIAWERSTSIQLAVSDPDKFKLPFKPEALIHCRTNLMMTTADREAMADALSKIPFQISFAREIDETVEFADIVFPETHYLERFDALPNTLLHTMSPSSGYWYWGVRQPVVDPPKGVRHWGDVLIELAERIGFLEDFNALTNIIYGLKEPYKLYSNKRYSREEIADTRMKSMFGVDHDLAWFKEHGYLTTKRKAEEMYPRQSIKARIPIYFEHFLDAGEFANKTAQSLSLAWDTSDYKPMPDWKPCPAYQDESKEHDLYVVNTTLPFHSYTVTPANPWLNEISEHHPYAYKIMINPVSADKKKIRDGDLIWLESSAGKVKGRVKVTECIHPEVLGIAGVFGGWAKGKPVGRGKGTHFNSLIPFSLDRIDVISNGLDACVKVKVYKAEE